MSKLRQQAELRPANQLMLLRLCLLGLCQLKFLLCHERRTTLTASLNISHPNVLQTQRQREKFSNQLFEDSQRESRRRAFHLLDDG